MKSSIKKLLVAAFIVTMAMTPAIGAKASTKSNAEKMLKAYKAKKYSQAQKYADKLPKNASKSCVKKLSKKAKAAYRKKLKSFNLDRTKGVYLWGYYLVDLNGNKKADLVCQYGTCEADARIDVYTYSGGKLKQIVDAAPSGHCSYYAYPGHAGMIVFNAHMGGEALSVFQIKKGKVKSTSYGSRFVDYTKGDTDYFCPPQLLDSHIEFSYPVNKLKLNDLK